MEVKPVLLGTVNDLTNVIISRVRRDPPICSFVVIRGKTSMGYQVKNDYSLGYRHT